MTLESIQNRYDCPKCDRSFGTKNGLNRHKESVSDERHERIREMNSLASGYEGGDCVYVLKS